jgi:hypothetical protein
VARDPEQLLRRLDRARGVLRPARNGMNSPTISSPTNFSMIASPSIRTLLDSR